MATPAAEIDISHFRNITKSYYLLRHVCLDIRPLGTTQLPLEEFSLNFIFEGFLNTCRENSIIILN